MWLKLTAPAAGNLSLWTNVFYVDGARADPLVRVPADLGRTGVWQKLTATIVPDAGKEVSFVGVYLMAEGFRGEALVDGIQLVDGGVPLSVPLLREAPAGAGENELGARLRASPILGAGPGKERVVATVDNEYLVIATRYGALGLVLYLALWAVVFVRSWRGRIAGAGDEGAASAAPCLTVAATVAALLVFNLVAGVFLHRQLMWVFWPLAGVALRHAA